MLRFSFLKTFIFILPLVAFGAGHELPQEGSACENLITHPAVTLTQSQTDRWNQTIANLAVYLKTTQALSAIDLQRDAGFWNTVKQLSEFAPPFDRSSRSFDSNLRTDAIGKVFGFGFSAGIDYAVYDASPLLFTAGLFIYAQESEAQIHDSEQYLAKLLEVFQLQHASSNLAVTQVPLNLRESGLSQETQSELIARIQALDARHPRGPYDKIPAIAAIQIKNEKAVRIAFRRAAVKTVYGPIFVASLPSDMFDFPPALYVPSLIRQLVRSELLQADAVQPDDPFYHVFE